jgi:outer membrane receptor protein involved in Fe transport
LAKNWDVTAQASYLDTSQEVDRNVTLFPPGTVLPIGPDGNIAQVSNTVTFPDGLIGNPEVFERHARLNVSAFYSGFARHLFRLGGGGNYGDLYKVRETKNFGPGVIDGTEAVVGDELTDVSDTPFAFLPEKDRKNYYFFVQDVWDFAPDWDLTAGVRYDNYSDFGDTVNPRLALVWSARYDLTAKLLYGRAFRAPSFAELFNRNNPVVLGNPNLDPEQIQTAELEVDFRPRDNVRLAASGFHYWWKDIIRFVPDASGASSTAQNTGRQTGLGFELEADWRPVRMLRLLGNYAYQESRDEDADADAGNAPRQQLYLRGDWDFLPHWQLNPQLNVVMDRKRPPGDPRADLADYAIVDLTLRRRAIKDHLEIALSARNLFDADAREPSPAPGAFIPGDLPLAGRSFFGEVRLQF